MNEATANALLKSLEEPPEGVHFLLVSHAAERLLPTVRSRTRAVPMRVPEQSVALSQLKVMGISSHSGWPLTEVRATLPPTVSKTVRAASAARRTNSE